MTEFECDTIKLNEVGESVVTRADELASLFEELYKKIYNIQKNGVWLGLASDHFLNNISSDSEEIMKFCSKLKDYGNVTISTANSLNKIYDKYKRTS